MVVEELPRGDAEQAARSRLRGERRCPKTTWCSSCWILSRRSISRPSTIITPKSCAATAFRRDHDGQLLVYADPWGLLEPKGGGRLRAQLAFRAVVGDDPPDFRTISDFRKIHLARFGPCSSRAAPGWRDGYGQAWKPVHRRDEDGSERLAAQGDELRLHEQGNQRLEAEIEQLLKKAEQLDAEQDAALGSRRGDELPDELKRREERLAKIREAKARLEAEACAQAEDEERRRDEEQVKREAEGRKRRGKEPARSTPRPRTRRKRTSPTPKRRS